MKRIVFVVLFTFTLMKLFSQNLVINPGFEKWDKTNKPTGWTTSQNCLKDSLTFRSGSYSCRLDGGTKYLGQTVVISPEKKYRLTFFYRTTIIGSGNGCRIWCYWKDAEGNNLADPATDDNLRPSKYLKSDTWQQFSADIHSPTGAVSFYLEVRTYSNSITYFDDFVFEDNVATINPEEKFSDVKIYPVPASDFISVSNLSNIQHIYIQNISGKTVKVSDFNGEETITIPVADLSNGVYIIKIATPKLLVVRKFIKKS